jgi:trk system potassium uptake protein
MRIIVIGGTGLAEQVADALHRAGDEVTVIDTEPGRESALAKAGLRAMYGDALVPSTLEAAGALKADVLVACTRSDEDNLVISLLAKSASTSRGSSPASTTRPATNSSTNPGGSTR